MCENQAQNNRMLLFSGFIVFFWWAKFILMIHILLWHIFGWYSLCIRPVFWLLNRKISSVSLVNTEIFIYFAYKKERSLHIRYKHNRISYRLLNSTLTSYRESYTFAKAGPNLRVVSDTGETW